MKESISYGTRKNQASKKLFKMPTKKQGRKILKNKKRQKKARELAKKNDNFYMLFKDGGSQKVRELINISPPAAQIFMFLAEQADRTNAVVASGKALRKISQSFRGYRIKSLENFE